jgi:hypothetical protein
MAQLAEAIARYHRLLEDSGYRDLSWAEELQVRMRAEGLTDSGRLLAPLLRPAFVTREQLARLRTISARLSCILHHVETLVLGCPDLLKRMQMLPAEKMLASLPCGYSRSSIASQMDAGLRNGTMCMRRLETSKPVGLAYTDRLADMFLRLPIMREFVRGGCRVSKLDGTSGLLAAILTAWREFGGTHKPNIAIVEIKSLAGSHGGEGDLLARTFQRSGVAAQVVPPDQLEFKCGALHAGSFAIDVVFRRLSTHDLLVRFDLSHPLLLAYRERAVCIVNGFRSEMMERRAVFELLTDGAFTSRLPAEDRKLLHSYIPWTRVVRQRKTTYRNAEIDLVPFILRARQQLVLRPNDESGDGEVSVGSEMTQSDWTRAVGAALHSPYVAQEHFSCDPESFPLLRYGELQMKQATVSIQPHIFDGQLHGASAALQSCSDGYGKPLALAPVLLLE